VAGRRFASRPRLPSLLGSPSPAARAERLPPPPPSPLPLPADTLAAAAAAIRRRRGLSDCSSRLSDRLSALRLERRLRRLEPSNTSARDDDLDAATTGAAAGKGDGAADDSPPLRSLPSGTAVSGGSDIGIGGEGANACSDDDDRVWLRRRAAEVPDTAALAPSTCPDTRSATDAARSSCTSRSAL
jgi:hypothetical protein